MSSEYIAVDGDRILVTGSNGFIGSKVVEKLLEYGFTTVRCLVRSSSNLDRLKKLLGAGQIGRNVELVKQYGENYSLPYVILRPGYVFGPGKTQLNGRVAINTFGFFIQVDGSYLVPLSFVDNCAEAIVLAGLKPGVDGEVFNVVDDELLTRRQFLREYKKKEKGFSVRIPYSVAYILSLLWEKYSESSKGQLPPVFNRRRCAAEWKGNRYSNQKLHERLGWKPTVPMERAMEAFLGQ